MRFKDEGLEADAAYSGCNGRRPQSDIAGESFKNHELFSFAAEGYG
jgi:hypothetical protein